MDSLNKPVTTPMEDYKRKQLAGLFGGKDYMPTDSPEAPAAPQTPKLEDEAEKRMTDIVEQNIASNAPETEEERRKREKRERSRKIISAVSDGVRAISNLVFTTKGAPSSYDGSTSMYKSVSDGIEKRKAEREAKQHRYNYWANHAAEREQARNARKMEAYRNQLANAYQDRKLKLEAEKQKAVDERELAKLDLEQQKLDLELKKLELQPEVNKAKIAAYKAQAAANNARRQQIINKMNGNGGNNKQNSTKTTHKKITRDNRGNVTSEEITEQLNFGRNTSLISVNPPKRSLRNAKSR